MSRIIILLTVLSLPYSAFGQSDEGDTEEAVTETETTTTKVTREEMDDDEEGKKGSVVLSVAGIVNNQVKNVNDGRERMEMNVGGGILVEAGVNDNFGIETGALFISRQYDFKDRDVRYVQQVDRLHIPVVARFWPVDYVSVAAGPFAAFRTGDVETSLTRGSDRKLKTGAREDVEYGLDAALTLNLAVNDKTGLFLEGRYSALFEQFEDEDSDEISALAGLKVDL